MDYDAKVVIGTEVDTSGVEDGVMTVSQFLKKAEQKLGRSLTSEERKQAVEYYYTLRNNFEDFSSSVESGISKMSSGLKNVVKNVTRWGLAIFGVRSAYMMVRSAMSTISSQDKQLKADIDYIKNAIAYTLEPVVRRIVELAKQLLFYIGWLIKQWTGKNIFENANKSLKNANGEAKKLSKTLAGFDEMNVLSDTSGGGGTENIAPSFDLSKLEGVEVPEWLKTIRDIGQWIIDNWEDVVFGLLLTKLFIDLITGNWIGVVIDFLGLLVLGLVKLWNAFKTIHESIKELWDKFVDWFSEKWDALKEKIKEIWQNIVDWVKEKWSSFTTWIGDKVSSIGNFFKTLWQGIKDGVATAVQWIKDKFKSIVDFFSNLISKIVGFFKNLGTKVGDAIGGAFKSVINGILKAIENILNFPIKQVNKLLDVINAVPGINIKKLSTFSLPRLAKGGIINMPGKGVPLGGGLARGGEVAPEGVIPLTDSQQMALLGETIGKYININATVPVYVGNRMVARELKRINAEDDFAYNR